MSGRLSDGRDWRDLRERLSDLGELAGELGPEMAWGRARFLFAIVAPMAEDAALLARDLESELRALAIEHGVPLPAPEGIEGGGSGE
ncbi:hypothetical protein SAMN05216371_1332 [Streptomyces sp. TLI_053]|uniref:hypothetical protein n=1 Tax=Streptomyces sp. TLI_053 TaxID=1855352 RepID=UPI00087B6A8A|nr:hypothetical protein [Streptomyces sp. TLI_053]SDT11966.1 hypothetical protein SAMN05216371_1332 [Streptomyces sp. TLI_053]